MNAVPTRKPNLQDLMVLTASTAVGLALARYYLTTPTSLTPKFDSQGVLFFDPGYQNPDLRWWLTLASFFLAAWSPALLYARIRSPRPRFWAMIWSPGFLVSAVATFCVILFFGQQFLTVARDGWPGFAVPATNGNQVLNGYLDVFSTWVLPRLRKSVGLAPAIAMLVAIAICRRRAASDWVDRVALALGTAWGAVYWV